MSKAKEAELETLDKMVRLRMIKCLGPSGEIGELTQLNTVVQYLSKNNAVAEKGVSTVEDDIAKRLAEASERRKNNESK